MTSLARHESISSHATEGNANRPAACRSSYLVKGTPSRPLGARALTMFAPRPATGPTLALRQFLSSSTNATFPGRLLFGIFNPADELVARQWCDVLPRIEDRGVGDQSPAQVSGKLVYCPAGHPRTTHEPTVALQNQTDGRRTPSGLRTALVHRASRIRGTERPRGAAAPQSDDASNIYPPW